jgi:hypothetical protein
MLPRWPFVLLPLLACRPTEPVSGTAVGNPNGMSAVAASGTDLRWTQGRLDLRGVSLEACTDGALRVTAVDASLDLLSPSPLALPEGDWCALAILGGSTVTLVGDAAEGATLTLSLLLDNLRFEADLEQTDLLIELGSPGWIDAGDLWLEPGEALTIGPSSEWHDYLASDLADQSALFVDLDHDGLLSETERSSGALAAPDNSWEDDGWDGWGWWE